MYVCIKYIQIYAYTFHMIPSGVARLPQAADMGLGPFAVTRSRSLVVAFSQTLFFEDVVILASKGKPEHNPWGFLFPLAPAVWAALLMAMTCTWAALLILGVWDFESGRVNRALDALFLQIRTLLRQGESYIF